MREGQVVARAEFVTENTNEREVQAALSRLAGDNPEIWSGAALVSVVPASSLPWNTVLDRLLVETLWVHGECSPGLRVAVTEPARVGPDRVANALGLLATYGSPAIAVDLGTATTLEVVNAGGEFVGGAIAAGVLTSLRALHTFTAKLPLVELRLPEHTIGHNTESAMLAGAVFGHAGLIDTLIERTRVELGVPAIAVATGGLAPLIVPFCRNVQEVAPDLTFAGLHLAWEKRHAL